MQKISFYFGKWAERPAIERNGVYWTKFTDTGAKYPVLEYTTDYLTALVNVGNVFGTNDVLVADCNDGSIRMLDA